jgi:signal transduction histidine kinase
LSESAPSLALAANGAEIPDAHRSRNLQRQQLALLARQATRSPFAIVIAVGFVTFTVWSHVPLWLVAVWAVTLATVLFSRRWYALRALRNMPEDPGRALRALTWFAFANGAATGAAAPLFFSALPLEAQALLTMTLVCWSAGGVATAAAYARAFYVFVGPTLVPVALYWMLTGTVDNVVLGTLIALFGVIQIFFVRDNEALVRESFLIRYENERLLAALEHERQEVVLARDRAEDASRAKSRFLAAASHDLRQPLHALSLYSAALRLRAPDGPTSEIADHIGKAQQSLSALVDALLDISKLDAGVVHPNLQRVSVQGLVLRLEEEFRPLARSRGLEFRVAPATAWVQTDPVLLERILRNLLENAFKYTSTGGVTLETEIDPDSVRIHVRDTGRGFPADEREHIFEEFYQIGNPERDRVQGLGLGLAIVRRLAQLLGIKVSVESEVGHGSVFCVSLPRTVAPEAASAEPVGARERPARTLAGTQVLVVDDEPAVRIGTRTLLESWGCKVVACGGYDEAVALLDRHPLRVDLMLADLRLRQYENGVDTIRRLRRRLGEVPALLVTGDTAPERLREAQASGLPLLHKPLAADTLKEAMLGALQE